MVRVIMAIQVVCLSKRVFPHGRISDRKKLIQKVPGMRESGSAGCGISRRTFTLRGDAGSDGTTFPPKRVNR
jgi:hypothetical protein